ncbi:hypothetical protein ASPWEDRAFT_429172 [Aspergillus wentii DTO 134E9]|uniref:Lipase n=1 Tax=Aspergillus wentii DTO 134E9 TaxID=1073089 RepID=A0A1L9RPH2_ASPWE|nr:uncharacterized protein ASPWEDRAFT_429172 [Aspergillus wentii DTO 134E9]KAI9924130.1 hypothetical protein MW887_007370 [Aspergillus wentii]OJJ36824.1 hypothetical protein ASPWEDRAFT_429172 [Aspergillus wentii DTO 134E9]
MRLNSLISALGLVSAVSASSIRHNATSAANVDLLTTWSNMANDSSTPKKGASDAAAVASELKKIQDTHATVNMSVEAACKKVGSLFGNGISDLIGAVAGLVCDLALVPADLLSLLNGYIDLELNSDKNKNPAPWGRNLYPTKALGDTPYSVAENSLREAIYIPKDFGYGKDGKKPMILVPGTAVPAGLTYYFNFGKLGSVADVDVVWVNVPNASLGDAQVNSEYVAYAINYISAMSDSKVSVLSWSQGGLNTQWALKYWPSTRSAVEDFIAISPDYHGSELLPILCPTLEDLVCTPAFWQQGNNASFVETLRDNGGNSAYVPTTNIFSSWDEIVAPMDEGNASAILADTRKVGVTNNHLQTICSKKPAGGIYTHEGVLYNPLAWALAVDALKHDGPGNPSRLDLDKVCEQSVPEQFGLGLDQVLGTEGLLLVAVAEAFTYSSKSHGEPPIASYAALK